MFLVPFVLSDFADLNNTIGVFTYEVAKCMVHHSSVEEALLETRELVSVDLSVLKSREDLLCFYGNLVNLFTVHALLSFIGGRHPKVKIHFLRRFFRDKF